MKKCRKGFKVQPCRSAAGYYMGTLDEFGFPNCRLTTQYAKTEKEAEKLVLDRQGASENRFCNECGRCF